LIALLAALIATFATVQANIQQHQYEQDLMLDQMRDLTLTASKPIAFFRVSVPQYTNSSFFEVYFSACSAGTIRVFHSKCVQGQAGCNDASDQWFPSLGNAQDSYYTILDASKNLQKTQSLGRIANNQNEKYIHFFGVEMVNKDLNGEVATQILMRTFTANSVAHSFSSSPVVALDTSSLKLSWKELDYCGKASAADPNVCEVEIPIDPVEYTVFVLKRDSVKENVNFGTACGLFKASKNVKRTKTSKSAIQFNAASQLTSSGTYVIGVGADVPTQKYTVDYAYEPVTITIQSKTVTSYRPLLVLFILALIGTAVAGAAAGAFYYYKKRVHTDGEFATLT